MRFELISSEPESDVLSIKLRNLSSYSATNMLQSCIFFCFNAKKIKLLVKLVIINTIKLQIASENVIFAMYIRIFAKKSQ